MPRPKFSKLLLSKLDFSSYSLLLAGRAREIQKYCAGAMSAGLLVVLPNI